MSEPTRLDQRDAKKVLKGAAIAGAGAALAYLTQWATNTDLGEMAPLVTAALAVLANVLRKYLTRS